MKSRLSSVCVNQYIQYCSVFIQRHLYKHLHKLPLLKRFRRLVLLLERPFSFASQLLFKAKFSLEHIKLDLLRGKCDVSFTKNLGIKTQRYANVAYIITKLKHLHYHSRFPMSSMANDRYGDGHNATLFAWPTPFSEFLNMMRRHLGDEQLFVC